VFSLVPLTGACHQRNGCRIGAVRTCQCA